MMFDGYSIASSTYFKYHYCDTPQPSKQTIKRENTIFRTQGASVPLVKKRVRAKFSYLKGSPGKDELLGSYVDCLLRHS